MQSLGRMADATVQQLSRDHGTGDIAEKKGKGLEGQTGALFEDSYGVGKRLN